METCLPMYRHTSAAVNMCCVLLADLSAPNGMPVADDILMPMSYLIAQQVAAAEYYKLRVEYKQRFAGLGCGGIVQDDEAGTGFASMSEME